MHPYSVDETGVADGSISKVLVTGATGFVGQALCAALDRRGIVPVRALRSTTGMQPVRANDLLVGDLSANVAWDTALQNVDAVVHLAAHVHQMNGSNEDRFREVNWLATEHLAKRAQAAGVKRFVFMSTVKVHGERTDPGSSFREGDAPAPQDAYARSKWRAEQCLEEIGSSGAMAVTILRPPLVYGPGVKANFLALLKLATTGWPLPLAGISNARSLIYVDNLVSALALALTAAPCATGVRTFLVSDQHDLSTTDLIASMRVALNRPRRLFAMPRAWLEFAGLLGGQAEKIRRLTESLRVDSGKFSAELGWHPPFTVERAVALTCDWYRATALKSAGPRAQ